MSDDYPAPVFGIPEADLQGDAGVRGVGQRGIVTANSLENGAIDNRLSERRRDRY